MSHASPLKKVLSLLLKLLLVAGLFWFLADKGLLSMDATRRAFTRLDLLGTAAALMLVSSFLGPIRWQWLLEAQGIRLPFWRTVQLTYIGNFFNIALPGAVSGDFVKAYYVANEAQGLKARAFGSILFDRVVGLSALMLVSAAALTADLGSLYGSALLRVIRFPVILAAAGFLVFYLYLFLVNEASDPLMRLLGKLSVGRPRFGSVMRIYEGLRHYHNHRWTVVKSLLISIAIHLMVATSCLLYARALGESSIETLAIFVVVPLGLLVTALPVLPAGVGTGHAAFAFLFGFLGSQRGGDVFSLNALLTVLVGAIGGLVYLRYRSGTPRSVFAASSGSAGADPA